MEVETDSEALSSEENPSTEERTDCNENLDASISSLSSESSAENFNIVNMDSSVNCTPNTLKVSTVFFMPNLHKNNSKEL